MDEVAMINQEKFRHPYHDLDDMVFWFHDEEEVLESSQKSRTFIDEEEEDKKENEENNNSEERKAFWELQEELLQTTLYRTTSFEARVRKAAKDAITKLNSAAGHGCSCRKTAAAVSCARCGLKEMSTLLQNDGFDCVVCVSKWKSSSQIPAAGQHTYLEVVESGGSKKGDMRVIIELNFRAEFEMAKSSQEYKKLVAKLPELFVGKIERLRNLVKILCGACKKFMEERKMYVAPWRKHKYMQAKWRGKPLLPPPVAVVAPPPRKVPSAKRVSMLSFDFVDTLLHNKTVEVI
ncbi:uncharacterized protein LOC131009285 [Salvia miltiorrhiza]|uniref:uncharacterized protein LOC131009285 n=1 Tax=Salvia miltiorrhiza TaxID=226208 RepID=UPI0025AD1098|nr:uncharacterized protein LOC131009285 [Salvia miltiorrhiza]